MKILYSVLNPNRENYIRHINLYPEEDLNENNGNYVHTIYVIQVLISALSEVFENIPRVDINGIKDEQTSEAIKYMQIIFGIESNGFIDVVFWNYIAALYESYVSLNRVSNSLTYITEL